MKNHIWVITVALTKDYKKDFNVQMEFPKDVSFTGREIKNRLTKMFEFLVDSISDSSLENMVDEKEEEE